MTSKLAVPSPNSAPARQPLLFRRLAVEASTSGTLRPEIDASVAIVIDAIFDGRGGQKLSLADFVSVSSDQFAQGKIAALDNLQRGKKLALKQFGAAAIMRQGGERADHRPRPTMHLCLTA
jgi:hypothetical protein